MRGLFEGYPGNESDPNPEDQQNWPEFVDKSCRLRRIQEGKLMNSMMMVEEAATSGGRRHTGKPRAAGARQRREQAAGLAAATGQQQNLGKCQHFKLGN